MDSKTKTYIGIFIFIVLIIIGFVFLRKKKQKQPESPSEQVQKELTSIKDRIKGIEGYTREYYRSEDNNGLTIGGTIMEQMIDIIIAVLKQKEVSAALKKFIQRKEDAVAIAELIETLGGEMSSLVSNTQLLKEVTQGKKYTINKENVNELGKKMDEKLVSVLSSNKEKYYNLVVGIARDNDEFKERPMPTIEIVDMWINRIKERGVFSPRPRDAGIALPTPETSNVTSNTEATATATAVPANPVPQEQVVYSATVPYGQQQQTPQVPPASEAYQIEGYY